MGTNSNKKKEAINKLINSILKNNEIRIWREHRGNVIDIQTPFDGIERQILVRHYIKMDIIDLDWRFTSEFRKYIPVNYDVIEEFVKYWLNTYKSQLLSRDKIDWI